MMGERLYRYPASGPRCTAFPWFALPCLALLVLVPTQVAAAEEESPTEPQVGTTAESDLDERAQRHWGSGMAYLEENDYAKALEAFEKAYELSGRARILVAIAVAHERRGDLPAAIAALDEYLRLAPTASNATEISELRGELEKKHQAQLRQMREAEHEEEATPSTPPPPVTEPPPIEGAGSVDRPDADDPPSSRSALKWSALGVGVAAGVAATVSGLLAAQEYDELKTGCGATRSCTELETQTGSTMAWVSTALTGVAAIGLGVGIWLVLDEPSPSVSPDSGSVAWGLHCGATGVVSDIRWSF